MAKKPAISRRDFLKGLTIGAVAAAAVAAIEETRIVSVPTSTTTIAKTATTTATTTITPLTVTVTPTPTPAQEPVYGKSITLTVNGEERTVEVEARDTLLKVLREKLKLTGTKKGCNRGECEACTVVMDGATTLSCMVLAISAEGKNILTVEGLAKEGQLNPIQEAFIEETGLQCGYCTPAFLMTTKALLDENPDPTVDDVKDAISGTLCRCHNYPLIINSVLTAARKLRSG